MELANLSTDHFPELIIQFPEFSIANAVVSVQSFQSSFIRKDSLETSLMSMVWH